MWVNQVRELADVMVRIVDSERGIDEPRIESIIFNRIDGTPTIRAAEAISVDAIIRTVRGDLRFRWQYGGGTGWFEVPLDSTR